MTTEERIKELEDHVIQLEMELDLLRQMISIRAERTGIREITRYE